MKSYTKYIVVAILLYSSTLMFNFIICILYIKKREQKRINHHIYITIFP